MFRVGVHVGGVPKSVILFAKARFLEIAKRIQTQQHRNHGKVYSVHAPEVECIQTSLARSDGVEQPSGVTARQIQRSYAALCGVPSSRRCGEHDIGPRQSEVMRISIEFRLP